MAIVSFKLQSKNSPAQIYVRVRKGRAIDLMAKIGQSIDLKDWDHSKQEPKNQRTVKLKNTATKILEIKREIIQCIDQDISEGKNIDVHWLNEIINPSSTTKIPNRLLDYFDFYLQLKKNSIKPSTIKKIKTFKNLLTEFEKWYNKKFQINEVDLFFQDKLEEFAKDKRFNYSQNYIADVIKFLKTLCKNASQNGLKTNPQTELLKAVKKKSPFIYLNETDISKIKSHPFKEDYLDNARDWLLISCDTGQRISDFMRFNKSMLRKKVTRKGNKVTVIDFTQDKTNKKMSVLITDSVQEILDKRNGDFPRKISEQRYNDYIKIVCEKAGIIEIVEGTMKDSVTKRQVTGMFEKYKLVVSHIGRRSFASNYFLEYPIDYLMNQTGHTSQRTFYDYIGKTSDEMTLAFADEIIRKR